MVPNGSSTDPVGYVYPFQSGTHFNFAGTAANGSTLHDNCKNGYPTAAAEQTVHQSTSANGVRLSDYTSTSASINGNEKSSQIENDAAMDGRPATTTAGISISPIFLC